MVRDKDKLKLEKNAKDVIEEELKENVDNTEGNAEDLEKKKQVKKVKTNTDFPYVIELYDILGSASKRTARFGAKRQIIDSNVFLVNEKYGFKEPEPQDNEEFKTYKLNEVIEEIKKAEDKLSKARKGQGQHSERDLIDDIRILKGFKRSIELSGVGSYMLFDSNEAGGKPLFMFDRKGNFKLPVFKNIDYSLLYVPTEANIDEASDLIKENDEKNGNKGAERLYTLTLLALMSLTLVALIFFLWKQGQINTQISGDLINVSRDLTIMGDYFQTGTENLLNLTDSIEFTEPAPSVEPNVNNIN